MRVPSRWWISGYISYICRFWRRVDISEQTVLGNRTKAPKSRITRENQSRRRRAFWKGATHQAVIAHLHPAPCLPLGLIGARPSRVGRADVSSPVGGVEPDLLPQAPHSYREFEVEADAWLPGTRELLVEHPGAKEPVPVDYERAGVDLRPIIDADSANR